MALMKASDASRVKPGLAAAEYKRFFDGGGSGSDGGSDDGDEAVEEELVEGEEDDQDTGGDVLGLGLPEGTAAENERGEKDVKGDPGPIRPLEPPHKSVSTFFSARLGITGIEIAKTARAICFFCRNTIPKGAERFEYYYDGTLDSPSLQRFFAFC